MSENVIKARQDIKKIIDEISDDKVEMLFAYIKGLATGIDLMSSSLDPKVKSR